MEPAPPANIEKRLEEMNRQLEDLRRSLEELRAKQPAHNP
jgi:prefoldin subunit 5